MLLWHRIKYLQVNFKASYLVLVLSRVYPLLCLSYLVCILSCIYPILCLSNLVFILYFLSCVYPILSCVYPILCLSYLVFILSRTYPIFPILCLSYLVFILSCVYPILCLSYLVFILFCVYRILCLSYLVFTLSCVYPILCIVEVSPPGPTGETIVPVIPGERAVLSCRYNTDVTWYRDGYVLCCLLYCTKRGSNWLCTWQICHC